MNAAQRVPGISVEDYLEGERTSEVRHEYVDGAVYAMTGGKGRHSRIKVRVTSVLDRQLEGSGCEPFDSDFKVLVRRKHRTYFYYPDASVFCGIDLADVVFGDNPVVVFEVLSDSTRRIDEGEKRDNYLTIPSLQTYVMLEQSEMKAVVYQRLPSGDFDAVVYAGPAASVPLKAIGAELPLDEIYRGIS